MTYEQKETIGLIGTITAFVGLVIMIGGTTTEGSVVFIAGMIVAVIGWLAILFSCDRT